MLMLPVLLQALVEWCALRWLEGNFWICSEHTGHPLNGLDGKLCSGIKVIVSGVFLGRRLNERAPNSSSQILVSGLRMICDDVFTVQQGNKLVKENCFSLSVFFF